MALIKGLGWSFLSGLFMYNDWVGIKMGIGLSRVIMRIPLDTINGYILYAILVRCFLLPYLAKHYILRSLCNIILG